MLPRAEIIHEGTKTPVISNLSAAAQNQNHLFHKKTPPRRGRVFERSGGGCGGGGGGEGGAATHLETRGSLARCDPITGHHSRLCAGDKC